MPILVGSLGDLGLNTTIFSGHVSRRDALDFPQRVDPARPEFGSRWITVFHPAADLSELDANCLLQVKERLRPVVGALAAKGPFRMFLVSNSKYNDHFVAAWRAMTVTDPTYPSNPEMASSVTEACIRHGLSREQAALAEAEIDRRLASILVR